MNTVKVYNIIGWFISLLIISATTFLTWPWLTGSDYHNLLSIFYGSTHRTFWSLSWAYILFSCAMGCSTIINSLLEWTPLTPLSRLSFQAYLYNSIVFSLFANDARFPIYSSIFNLVRYLSNISFNISTYSFERWIFWLTFSSYFFSIRFYCLYNIRFTSSSSVILLFSSLKHRLFI